MKFSRLEIRLLRFVDDAYPFARDKAEDDSDPIIAVGERPIPTRDELAARFTRVSAAYIDEAIKHLISCQCIAKVYLHGKDDFDEIATAPGKRLRSRAAGPETGVHAYQVTPIGKDMITGQPWERIKRALYAILGRTVEENVRVVIAFLFGVLASKWFGFDVSKLKLPWSP